MSIFKKMLILVSTTIGVIVIALCIMGYFFVSNMSTEITRGQLLAYSDVAQKEVDNTLQAVKTFGHILQDDVDFIRAIVADDKATLGKIAKDLMESPMVDFVTICDAKGVVLVRGHDGKAGDTLPQSRFTVRVPLSEGKTIAGIESNSANALTMAAGLPMKHEDKIIGVAIIGTELGSGKFVDRIKALLHVECTIFMDDTRVSTTIMNQGQRAVGTKLGNADIYQRVMGGGERVVSRNVILGEDHDTAYWPWMDMGGKPGGMFFVGLSRANVKKALVTVVTSFAVTGLVVGILMLILGSLVARAIVGPLRAATAFAEDVSQGNLDGNLAVTTRDEVGVLARALGVMVTTLKAKMREAEDKSREAGSQAEKALAAMREAGEAKEKAESGQQALLTAAENVEQIVDRLSLAVDHINEQVEASTKAVSFQHDRVTASATAMEEMNATVLEVAKNASAAAESAERATLGAREGEGIVRQSIDSIIHVQRDTEQLKDSMHQLGTQAESISTVMAMINDIADQTNLLALNAAIEAARAGDAGRGFAVVADEVRKLAEKTMGATKDVGDAIVGIQSGAKASIEAVDRTGKNLEVATDLVSKSGESLRGIVSETEAIAGQIHDIAAASEEQAATSEEIAKSLGEINTSASETAQAMQTSTDATNDLADQAHQLQDLVRQIRNG
jgi:methyl-accepting chemotaxis protein